LAGGEKRAEGAEGAGEGRIAEGAGGAEEGRVERSGKYQNTDYYGVMYQTDRDVQWLTI